MPDETTNRGNPGPQLVELPHVRDKDFRFIYSNFAGCGRGAWDIAISFGLIAEAEPEQQAVIDLVTVNLTPALAKALAGVLDATVKQYEAENGEVKIPEVIRRAAEAARADAARLSQARGSQPAPADETRTTPAGIVGSVEPRAKP